MDKSKNRIVLIASAIVIALLVSVVVVLFLTMNSKDAGNGVPSYENQITYEQYNALSGEEQEAYFNTFPSIESFFEWYNLAKNEYEEQNGVIKIDGDETIDISNFGKNEK